MFPLDYKGFVERNGEWLAYEGKSPGLERLLHGRFMQAVQHEHGEIPNQIGAPGGEVCELQRLAHDRIYVMKERYPVHPLFPDGKGRRQRRHFWPDLGLLTHHDPRPKQQFLQGVDLQGEHIDRLRNTFDLSYFNNVPLDYSLGRILPEILPKPTPPTSAQ